MNQERWSTINRIFHAALEVEQSQRSALVATESGDDSELKTEVELLLQADSDAGSYLELPLMGTDHLLCSCSPLAPGDVLCDRFRIVREIAEGGMGHVFEAFDSELGVRIALKVIRPEIASNAEAVARFRQEVRLARSVTHPNICRTFDIEREIRTYNETRTELVFLTMEFLPGETLAQRLHREGPLQLKEALILSRQIAAALHAAHALGIVHRDMKPANIMLVPSESFSPQVLRVVVTDFGLARLDPVLFSEGLSSFTNPSNPIGTLAYMAPEQLEGSAVSPATDIYAFGLILFEMLTGKRAFPSNNLLSGIAQRLRGTVSLDQMLAPQTPANWHHAIKDCLAINPLDRPQDAIRVLKMLEEDPRKLLPRLRRSAFFSRKALTRLSSWTALSLAVLALFVGSLRLYTSRAASQVTPGALVYLTQVKNETGERSLDSLTELMQAGLSQSMQVNLLDQSRIGNTLQNMIKPPNTVIDEATAREIAMRTGAVRVIFATVTGSHGSYRLNVDIQEPDTDPARYRHHWPKRFPWKIFSTSATSATIPAELLTQIRSASDWIRHEAGESANDIARLDTPPEDVTTNSWEALSEYQRAMQLNHNRRPGDAVVALTNAVHDDPQFALAYGRLADIELTLHQEEAGFAAYKKALDPNLERRLSRRERDRIQGMYAIDSWDYASAVDAFRDYESFYPNDAVGWEYPTAALMLLGRDDEAIANLKHSLELEPKDKFAAHALASEYLIKGNYSAARSTLSEMNESSPSASTIEIYGSLAFLVGNYDQARARFTSLETSKELRERSRSFEMLADLDAELGDFSGAKQMFDLGIQEDIAQGNHAAESVKLAGRAWMNAKLGDFTGCSADLNAALAMRPGPSVYLMAESVLGQAIQLAPDSKSPLLRRQMVALTRNLPQRNFGVITDILRVRSRAEGELAAGHTSDALQQFRQLSVIDPPAAPREYLGRIMVAAAYQAVAGRASTLRREAMQAYAVTALHPSLTWESPTVYPAGFLADESTAYLQLAKLTGFADTNVEGVRSRLASLRGSPTVSNIPKSFNQHQQ